MYSVLEKVLGGLSPKTDTFIVSDLNELRSTKFECEYDPTPKMEWEYKKKRRPRKDDVDCVVLHKKTGVSFVRTFPVAEGRLFGDVPFWTVRVSATDYGQAHYMSFVKYEDITHEAILAFLNGANAPFRERSVEIPWVDIRASHLSLHGRLEPDGFCVNFESDADFNRSTWLDLQGKDNLSKPEVDLAGKTMVFLFSKRNSIGDPIVNCFGGVITR